jgi:hypothetical protein
MARIDIVREIRPQHPGEWGLCFQWGRYRFDDDRVEYGYRFVWRRDDGTLCAARGQARIPSIKEAKALMDAATLDGWGDRDGNLMENAAERLRKEGCLVDLALGYVGWPSREASERGRMTEQMMADERIIRDWSH